MPVLWLKFSDEASLPFPLSPAERARLDEIYNSADKGSVWNCACDLLGMPAGGGALLRWHDGVPYINWGLMTGVISCGSIEVVRQAGGGYGYAARGTVLRLPALVRSQWRTAQYVEKRLAEPLPGGHNEKILESTALGLALQAIMLRLPKHTPADLAGWLAAPDSAPAKLRRTILQMQAIQKRRTQLSSAWFELFPKRDGAEPPGPAFFWDEPPALTPAPTAPPRAATQSEWQGLPVCAGRVTGRAVLVRRLKDFTPPPVADFPVLVFPKAKPETTEVFSHASALLFAEGGALSHACTIAREQGIPCITGLGTGFFEQMENAKGAVFLTLDGASGSVSITCK